jgi:hypothetical protein
MSLMIVAEFGLWAAFGLLFWTKRLHFRFPAMGIYLALRVASMPVLLFLFYAQARHWFNDYAFDMYFYVYWTVYVVSAVLLYFICVEVFRSVLSAFPGLQRLGTVAFRWAALVSVILSLSTLSFDHSRAFMITHFAFRLMRSVSILELCLLAFLCLSMNALRLSTRDMAFGISLGFGLMSCSDFVIVSLISRKTTMTDPLNFVWESLTLVSLGIWVAYCAVPEPARKPILVPAGSLIFRWNEIATALGHTGTQVVVQPAGGSIFTGVESAVEEVLSQSLKSRASET